MDISKILESRDYSNSGLDELFFISCQSCLCFTPFLFHHPLPSNHQIHQIFCAECLPKSEDPKTYPSALMNGDGFKDHPIELLKKFKYKNPYYREFASFDRILITTDTAVVTFMAELEELPAVECLKQILDIFPVVHHVPNKKYTGLQEINEIVSAKVLEIRQYYTQQIEANETRALVQHGNCSVNDLIEDDTTVSTKVSDSNKELNVAQMMLSSDIDSACDICMFSEKDTLKYGDFVEVQETETPSRYHFFCFLTRAGTMQDKSVPQLTGKDVENPFQVYRDYVCKYCKQPSASIKCDKSDCNVWFHYKCGYENNCLSQFTEQYPSFCHEHQPISTAKRHGDNTQCRICWDLMPPYKPVSSFYAECLPEASNDDQSLEYTWYHRKCIQKFAHEAGFYFKCPHCFEKDLFTMHAQLHGIFVPNRDATWESEQDAYKDVCKQTATTSKCSTSK